MPGVQRILEPYFERDSAIIINGFWEFKFSGDLPLPAEDRR